MNTNQTKKRIYIVISQTGTLLSRIIKFLTRDRYNHASLSFEDHLEPMYAFGRLHPYNPIVAGFVKESVHYGTFKRFSGTEALVVAIEVEPDVFDSIKADVEQMYLQKKRYHYNYIGLYAAMFGIQIRHKDWFYCSEFVKHMMKKYRLVEPHALEGITRPMDFLKISGAQVIYRGKLNCYRP